MRKIEVERLGTLCGIRQANRCNYSLRFYCCAINTYRSISFLM